MNKMVMVAMMLMMGAGATIFARDAKVDKPEPPKYGWQKSLVGAVNFTQTSLNNWQQGGEDSWNWQLDLNAKFVNDQEKTNWANSGKVSYGRTKVGEAESVKSADEIFLESVLAYKLGTLVNPYVALTGRSQLTKNNPGEKDSKFLNPGYFTESFGAGFRLAEGLQTRLGLAFKQTVTTGEAFAVNWSDDKNTLGEIEKVRSEVGLESVTDYTRKIAENILYTAKLEMFSNLKGADEIDVRWENLLSAKVSKLLSVSFNVQLFYDKDIDLKRQIRQVLAVGLSYSFL